MDGRNDGRVMGEMTGEMTGGMKIEESLYLKGFRLSDGRDWHFFNNAALIFNNAALISDNPSLQF